MRSAVTVDGQGVARRSGGRRRHRQAPSCDGAAVTAKAVWAQLAARPATERPALMRTYLGQLPAHEVAHLLALSEGTARRDVLERLARRDAPGALG
jgi:DNA-directed RNA polymerase specialized sigma24 family protein